MPITPDLPFPKSSGDNIRSKDWNDAINEIKRLDTDKLNLSGGTLSGQLNVSGFVGIGTSTPDQPLTVTRKAAAYGIFRGASPGGGVLAGELLIGADTTSGVISMMSNHDLQLRAGGNDTKVVIKANGNVGIGEPNPSLTKLQVNGSIMSARNSDGTNAGAIEWYNLTNNKRWQLAMRSGDGDKLHLYHHDGNAWAGPFLNVNPNGNVGIGTTAPETLLRVKQSASAPALKVTANRNEADSHKQPIAEFRHENQTQGVGIGYASIYATGSNGNQNLSIFARGTGVLTLNAEGGGNVGIGTASPSHKFHVLTQDAVGLFESTGAQAYLRLSANDGLHNRVEITNRGGGRLSLWTAGGGDVFNITKGGNVGIGTDAPTQQLDVRGNIKLHSDGSLFAPGGVENLRILRGSVRADGANLGGGGFNIARISVGLYTISFISPFTGRPSASVTQVFPGFDNFGTGGDTRDNTIIVGLNNSQMRVKTGGSDGSVGDRDFSFIVVGPR